MVYLEVDEVYIFSFWLLFPFGLISRLMFREA